MLSKCIFIYDRKFLKWCVFRIIFIKTCCFYCMSDQIPDSFFCLRNRTSFFPRVADPVIIFTGLTATQSIQYPKSCPTRFSSKISYFTPFTASLIAFAITSSISSVIPGYTPIQKVSFIIRSVFSRLPAIRYPFPEHASDQAGMFCQITGQTAYVSVHLWIQSPVPVCFCLRLPCMVIRNPNQLGFEFAHASGRISLSSVPFSASFR